MYKYNAKVNRVVDGDTVDALVDLGFDTWKKVRIRMMGLNAPESRTKDLDETFILQSHGVGKYGRCLGELFVDDVNINKQLIKEGHAVEYHGGKR